MWRSKTFYVHLLNCTSRGDRSAFGKFFTITAPVLLAKLKRSFSDREDHEDFLHTMYVDIFERVRKGDFPCTTDSQIIKYMYSEASHRFIDHLRKIALRGRRDIQEQLEPKNSEQFLEDKIDRFRAPFVLEQLDEKERDVLLRRAIDEESFQSISESLGMSYTETRILFRKTVAKAARLWQNKKQKSPETNEVTIKKT